MHVDALVYVDVSVRVLSTNLRRQRCCTKRLEGAEWDWQTWSLRIDMCADMCADMCTDMCTDMCKDMCIGMCKDVCMCTS